MEQDVAGVEPLVGVAPEQVADEAPGPRRDELGHREVAADDLGEQAEGSGVLERVPAHEQRVQDDAERPQVGGAARVARTPAQEYFRCDVGRISVLPPHAVVRVGALEHDGLLE